MPALEPLLRALAAGWPPLELPFAFGAPAALWLAPPLLTLLLLWARRSLAGLGTARRRLALALRAALVLLVVGALAELLDVTVRRVQLDWALLRGAPVEVRGAGAPVAPSYDLAALLEEAAQERAPTPSASEPAGPEAPEVEGGTTGRLLDAKRRRRG